MFELALDGRKFTGIDQDLTATQDDYVLAHLRLAGVPEILRDPVGVERTREKRAEAALTQILLSGHSHHILAGLLTEEGKVWTRAKADANAARFGRITDPDEKQTMRDSLVKFVAHFFALGEPSVERPQRSSILRSTPLIQ